MRQPAAVSSDLCNVIFDQSLNRIEDQMGRDGQLRQCCEDWRDCDDDVIALPTTMVVRLGEIALDNDVDRLITLATMQQSNGER